MPTTALEEITRIWLKPKNCVVKDLPRLRNNIHIWNDEEKIQTNGDVKTILITLAKLLDCEDIAKNLQDKFEQYDLEDVCVKVITWESSLFKLLRLLTQSIPAPVSTYLLLNCKRYNFRQSDWQVNIVFEGDKVTVKHISTQQSNMVLQPEAYTPQKNFSYKWTLTISTTKSLEKLEKVEVVLDSKTVAFEEEVNSAWQIKVNNLLSTHEALINNDILFQ